MKYLCLAYGDPTKVGALSKKEFEGLVEKAKVHDAELHASGGFVSSMSLEWAAMSIRSKGGKVVATDGPFLETKEQVGGLVIIEARDLNEAVRIASMHAAAHLGGELGWGIELHPIAETCHQ